MTGKVRFGSIVAEDELIFDNISGNIIRARQNFSISAFDPELPSLRSCIRNLFNKSQLKC